MLLSLSADFFSKLKKKFRNTISVPNGLDPNQARHFVGPDLGPKCMQRLSADDKSRRYQEKARNHAKNNFISFYVWD